MHSTTKTLLTGWTPITSFTRTTALELLHRRLDSDTDSLVRLWLQCRVVGAVMEILGMEFYMSPVPMDLGYCTAYQGLDGKLATCYG